MAKNRVLYLIMLLVSAVSVGISGSKGSYIMLMSILILGGVSLVLLLLAFFTLKVVQSLENETIIKGETVEFSAEVRAFFISYAAAKVHFSEHGEYLEFSVKSDFFELETGKAHTYTFTVFGKYRGISYVGIEWVELRDFMGLFKMRKKIKTKPRLIVCPHIVPFSSQLFYTSPEEEVGKSFKMNPDDYANISDIRLYTPSDSVKHVHWKLSAKKNELLVKNYDVNTSSVTAILIDNRRNKDLANPAAIEDYLIETAVSLCDYNLGLNFPVMLEYVEEGAVSVFEQAQNGFDRLYNECSLVNFDAVSISVMLDKYADKGYNLNSLYILSARLDSILREFSHRVSFNGYEVNLIHFYNERKEDKSAVFIESDVRYHGACLEERNEIYSQQGASDYGEK